VRYGQEVGVPTPPPSSPSPSLPLPLVNPRPNSGSEDDDFVLIPSLEEEDIGSDHPMDRSGDRSGNRGDSSSLATSSSSLLVGYIGSLYRKSTAAFVPQAVEVLPHHMKSDRVKTRKSVTQSEPIEQEISTGLGLKHPSQTPHQHACQIPTKLPCANTKEPIRCINSSKKRTHHFRGHSNVMVSSAESPVGGEKTAGEMLSSLYWKCPIPRLRIVIMAVGTRYQLVSFLLLLLLYVRLNLSLSLLPSPPVRRQ
jgi:hypothetical protein